MKRILIFLALFWVSVVGAVDQYDIVGRTTAGTGGAESFKISELTEEGAPVAGDFLLCEESGGALRKCDVGDLPGGGGLTQTACTADGTTTGVAGNHYVCDVSGYTSDQDITFPSCTAGEKMQVTIGTEDTVYGASLLGVASVSLNGVTAAEWFELIQAGESVLAECVASDTWIVTSANLIPCYGKSKLGSSITTNTAAVAKLIAFDAEDSDSCAWGDTGNGYIVPRRTTQMMAAVSARPAVAVAVNKYYYVNMRVNSVVQSSGYYRSVFNSSLLTASTPMVAFAVTDGQIVDGQFVAEAADDGCAASSGTFISYTEILPK